MAVKKVIWFAVRESWKIFEAKLATPSHPIYLKPSFLTSKVTTFVMFGQVTYPNIWLRVDQLEPLIKLDQERGR